MRDSILKFAHVVFVLISFTVLLVAAQGCSTSRVGIVAREAVIADLKPIVEIEARAQAIGQILASASGSGMFDSPAAMGLKEHYDLYYLYHMAAAVHLAHAERQPFFEYVELARRELDAMESIMRSAGQQYFLRLMKEEQNAKNSSL